MTHCLHFANTLLLYFSPLSWLWLSYYPHSSFSCVSVLIFIWFFSSSSASFFPLHPSLPVPPLLQTDWFQMLLNFLPLFSPPSVLLRKLLLLSLFLSRFFFSSQSRTSSNSAIWWSRVILVWISVAFQLSSLVVQCLHPYFDWECDANAHLHH